MLQAHPYIWLSANGRGRGRRGGWKRENDLQKYSPVAPLAICGTAHPRAGSVLYYKGKGKETGTLHPVSCCEPIFLFCMPGQRIVCSTQMASNQFWSVMRVNKLPRPPAVPPDSAGGMSRRNYSFLLGQLPPLTTSLIFGPHTRCCTQEEWVKGETQTRWVTFIWYAKKSTNGL